MRTVQQIGAAIERLPDAEVLALVDRLRERLAAAWDRQIEADAQNGRFDALYAQLTKEDDPTGQVPLEEVLDDPKLS